MSSTAAELNLKEMLLWKARQWQRAGISFSEQETARILRNAVRQPVSDVLMDEILWELGFV